MSLDTEPLWSKENAVVDRIDWESKSTQFQDFIGYQFSDPSLLSLALITAAKRVDLIENVEQREILNNKAERLEFLGDSVLGLLIAARLTFLFGAEAKSKQLAEFRNYLSSREVIAEVGGFVAEYMMCGGLDFEKGVLKASIVENAIERLLGALQVDSLQKGEEEVLGTFFNKLYPLRTLERIWDNSEYINPIGELRSWLKTDNEGEYTFAHFKGGGESSRITVTLKLANGLKFYSSGSSKASARRRVAQVAIGSLRQEKNSKSG